eukprot:GCRY01002244.1.p1 GENE.GCRY01002244.1~~GCRY01002244.1.p1  ORF type:complete len:949 (-),score=213.04 GCRY01002244.1:265-3111(-)
MKMAGRGEMRGLRNFIMDIRHAGTDDKIEKRINKELANIRQNFKNANQMDGYNRKKYTAKLMYIYMLGVDIDFGHIEAVNLLSSNKYSEKAMGYLFCSFLMSESHEMVPLIINSISSDLHSRLEQHQCLALGAIANIGGKEMAEALVPDVQKTLLGPATRVVVRKKAALTLLRMYRNYPETISPSEVVEPLVELLTLSQPGLDTAILSLLLAFAAKEPEVMDCAVPKCISLLSGLHGQRSREFPPAYNYYNIPSPWLQVKILRLLQYLPIPDRMMGDLRTNLQLIIRNSDQDKNNNYNNAKNSILFEAINLAIQFDSESELLILAATFLGNVLGTRDTANMRYMTLEGMSHLATSPVALEEIKRHQDTVITALRDDDISIRLRALDLLYEMCDKTNSRQIVSELLNYLIIAEYQMKEEMVLKVAILAEKFAPDFGWYVDVVLQLLNIAGDFVSDEVWHRVVVIVTNNEELREYAATTMYNSLRNTVCHGTTIKVGGFILGEFGHLLVDGGKITAEDLLNTVYSKYNLANEETKGILLTAMGKLANIFPSLASRVGEVFAIHLGDMSVDIQQRAVEYSALMNTPEAFAEAIWAEMPPFSEHESALLSRLKNMKDDVDKSKWTEKDNKEDDEREKMSAAGPTPQIVDNDSPTASPASTASVSAHAVQGRRYSDNLISLEDAAPTTKHSTFVNDLIEEAQEHHAVEVRAAAPFISGFKALMTKSEGVLVETPELSVGVKSQWKGHLARMALYYTNIGSDPISNLQLMITNPHSYTLIPHTSTPQVAPGGQVMQLVDITLNLPPSSEAPLATLAFSVSGASRQLALTLPIHPNKFAVPYPITAASFFDIWRSFSAIAQSEVQSVFKASTSIAFKNMNEVFSGLNFALIPDADPIPTNFVLAAQMPQPPPGEALTVLARVESNIQARMFRVTVRCSHGFAQSAHDALKLAIGE